MALPRQITENFGAQLGQYVMHKALPDQFELYAMSLQVVDAQDLPVSTFIFPVLPESYRETDPSSSSSRRTLGGIHTSEMKGFMPKKISMTGTFGRSFKFNTGGLMANTGFGNLKYLEEIKNLSHGNEPRDTATKVKNAVKNLVKKTLGFKTTGETFKTYFFNWARNVHYVVEDLEIQYHANNQKSALWFYDLTMTAVKSFEGGLFDRRDIILALSLSGKLINEQLSRAQGFLVDTAFGTT